MSDHKSAAKKARRDVEARLRNRGNRSLMKTEVKKFLSVLATGKKADAAAVQEGHGHGVDQRGRGNRRRVRGGIG